MQKLIAGSFELDLEKTISIPLIFKISDVRDISKRSGSFSKTIILPGTENNNRFFDGIYDFNNDFTNFNPNVKTPCLFSLDGDEHINGYLQLKEVTRDDKGNVNYNVVIYDNVLNFWTSLDKKKLGDLDFSELDHDYTKDNIVTSWGHVWTDGYTYPLLFNNKLTQKTKDFKPIIFKKYLLDKIISETGFTWSGNLKTDPDFEKEITVNSIDRPTISPAVAASKTFRVDKSAPELILTENTPNVPIASGLLPIDLDDETTPPNDDTNGLWSVNTFTAPLTGQYQLNLDRFQASIEYDYVISPFTLFGPQGYGDVDVRIVVEVRDDLSNLVDTQNINFLFPTQNLLRVASGTSIFNSNQYTSPLFVNGLVDIYLGQNWTIEFFFEVTGTSIIKNFFGTAPQPGYQITEIRVNEVRGDVESLFILYAYDDNVPLNFIDFINLEFDQKKVIQDIISRYNCFVYVNPEDANDIVFNIRDEFYQTGPILDYTDKKDFNTRDKIKLIGELQSEEMLLTYSKGDDATNKGYTDTVGDENIYGQFKYNFANEFVKGEKKITSPYNPTPLILHGGISGAVVPSIHSQEPIVGMRVLYFAGLIEVGTVSFNFEYRDANGNIQTDIISGYPYAGHYNDPFTPTLDINFGGLPFPDLYYEPNQTTENNLFNRYWANTIKQIADGRLVVSKFNLTAADVFFIKNNPNTRLFVDNKYYYINKIMFEGNEELNTLTTVELLTVEDELKLFFINLPIKGNKGKKGNLPSFFRTEEAENNFGGRTANDGTSDPISNERSGINNTIGRDSVNVRIIGDGNFVDSNRSGVFIQGDNNRVFGSNVTLIGTNGITVRGDDVSVINGVITKGCKTSVFFNKIDGGLNSLRNKGANCEINKICSEVDGEFNLFVVSLFNKINSVKGITDEI